MSEPVTLEEFLFCRRIAVVGVSRNPRKYGYRIYFDLRRKGYEVYAINPSVSEIDGDLCYPDLASLPVRVEVVNLVVPSEQGKEVIEECLRLKINRVWFQPGAESEELISFCEHNQMKVVAHQCLMALSAPRS